MKCLASFEPPTTMPKGSSAFQPRLRLPRQGRNKRGLLPYQNSPGPGRNFSTLQLSGACIRLQLLQRGVLSTNGKALRPSKFQRNVGISMAVLQPESKSRGVGDTFPESGDEVIDGCRLTHGKLANGSVNLHYVESGDPCGELVLLLHGFPNFWYVWEKQFRALTDAGYHVIAPDLRGFNASDKPLGVHNYSRQKIESDVLRFIDHFGGGRPVSLVGHDWGGFIAWALAEDYPEKLSRMIIVNAPHPTVFGKALTSNPRQMLRSWYIFFFQLPGIPELVIRMFRFRSVRKALEDGPCKPMHQEGIERHVQAYAKTGAVTPAVNLYRASFSGFWKRDKDPAHIRLPVLSVWGEQDRYILPDLFEPPQELVLNATVIRSPNASHWPMWDEPATFNDHLLQFLKRRSS